MSSNILSDSRAEPTRIALVAFALAFAAIGGAWIFQGLGYPPCDLCYEQRYAFYAGVPLALLAFALSRRPGLLPAVVFGLIALAFLANFGLAIYHSGVEMKLWEGPTACTGAALSGDGGDLLAAIDKVKVVRCDDVGLRVFGLTLANWNVFISLTLAALGAIGAASSLRTPRAS